MFDRPTIVVSKTTPATSFSSLREIFRELLSQRALSAVVLLATWLLAPACEPGLPDYTGGSSLPNYETEHDGGSKPGNGDGRSEDESCSDDLDGAYATSEISISEIAWGENGFVELHSNGTEPLHFNDIAFAGALTSALPTGTLQPQEKRLFRTAELPASGELGLIFGGELIAYLCWGAVIDTPLHEEAFFLGLWQANGACALQPASGQSLHLRGSGLFPGDYVTAPPSPAGCVE